VALRFTVDGVFGAPTTLQLRVAVGRPGRIRVGAPPPSRALTVAEVVANVRHFRDPGPRAAPIERVVLSGLPDDWLPQLAADVIQPVRGLGVEGVVLHLDEAQARALPGPVGGEIAVTSRHPAHLGGLPIDVALVLPLDNDVLKRLASVMAEVDALQPRRVTFVWPFPDGTSARPAAASSVGQTLAAGLAGWRDAPFPWGIKGLPRCALDPLEGVVSLDHRIWRTRNRYYVDADHQRTDALMFEPDLVRLVKSDRCRFCAVDDRCDGVASRWLAEGLVEALTPLEAP